MISAFIFVNENRKKLVLDLENKSLSPEDSFKIAQSIVLAYQENQLAFNELLHYQEKGEILGKHSIFDDKNLRAGITNMCDLDALKLYKNMSSQISRLRTKLKVDPLDEEALRNLKLKETKRQLLKTKLNEKQIL
jgi:hypothetical protein